MIAPSDYTRIARAIAWLDEHAHRHPALADAARAAGLSDAHFQRVFTRWAGISPKRFLQARTAESALHLLRDGRSVLDAAYESGLSGGSRLHDLIVHAEAVTPGELKRFPDLPTHMAGGPDNPLGARALYLGSTLFRIHGTNEPWKIGAAVSSGCIRMANDDAIDLYDRAKIGATVIVR